MSDFKVRSLKDPRYQTTQFLQQKEILIKYKNNITK